MITISADISCTLLNLKEQFDPWVSGAIHSQIQYTPKLAHWQQSCEHPPQTCLSPTATQMGAAEARPAQGSEKAKTMPVPGSGTHRTAGLGMMDQGFSITLFLAKIPVTILGILHDLLAPM